MNVQEPVTNYLEYCRLRKELDEKTLKAYRIDLTQFFRFVCCDEPDKITIEQYITDLHQKYKQKTVKRKIASVKAYYSYLEEEALIVENPFHKIRVKFKETAILPRVIPRNDIERLLRYAYFCLNNSSGNSYKELLRDITVMELLFATGARVYEVSNIQTDCIDLSSGLVRFMGKGGKERYVQVVDQDVINLLYKYFTANHAEIEKSGYFLVNQRGERYSEQSIRRMLQKYTNQAGIHKKITPHMFRHSFATYLIEEGVDISYIQQILGHSSIKTTQIYIHIAAGKQSEILQTYHPRRKMNLYQNQAK